MIRKESLVIEWINKVSSENRKADKILVEKAITFATKAAYVAILIKYDANKFEKYILLLIVEFRLYLFVYIIIC